MIVFIFITLFLLIALGAFVRGAFEHSTAASQRNLAYERAEDRYIPEADNL